MRIVIIRTPYKQRLQVGPYWLPRLGDSRRGIVFGRQYNTTSRLCYKHSLEVVFVTL